MSSPRFAPWLMPETITSGSKPSIRPSAREPDAVHRRAVARVADGAVVERHLGHPQRAPERDRAGGRGAVAVGRDHGQLDVLERDQRAPQRLQALGVDPVVVRQQDAQHGRHDSTEVQGPAPAARPTVSGWRGNRVAVCRIARGRGAVARARRRLRALRAPRGARPARVRRPGDGALRQDEVRDEIAQRIADREIDADPGRSRVRRPALEAAVADVVEGDALPGASSTPARRRCTARCSPTAARGGAGAARGRRRSCGPRSRSTRQSAGARCSRPPIRSCFGIGGGRLENTLRAGRAPGARPVGAAPLGCSPRVALLVAAALRAPTLRLGLRRAALGLALAGGATVAATAIGRAIVLSTFDTSHGDAVVGTIWSAFLADLRLWGLARRRARARSPPRSSSRGAGRVAARACARDRRPDGSGARLARAGGPRRARRAAAVDARGPARPRAGDRRGPAGLQRPRRGRPIGPPLGD